MIAPPATASWTDLFAPCRPDPTRATLGLNVVRRGGEPFLLLPREAALAARALALYPAQSLKARAAKLLLKVALRSGLNPRLERISLPIAEGDPFAGFLEQTARLPQGAALRFALLAGNARTPGRRFVLLLFDAGGEAVAVVKAGAGDAARRLLAHEENFLQTAPPNAPGLPKVRSSFNSSRTRAFSLDFVSGHSPRSEDTGPLAELLTAWVSVGELVPMKSLGAWQRLTAATSGGSLPVPVQALTETRFHPTLAHGDCAPWNVKVARGHWTLLDWERGERAGVPGWDWFHFVMQPAVLVRREPVPALLARFERLLVGEDFGRYAQHAGIAENARALALAYLCYCNRVARQADGAETLAALETAAARRWYDPTT